MVPKLHKRFAVVILEGPCTIEPISGGEIRLRRGKLLGRCETPASQGFTVHTPNATVVDLGTHFGVGVESGSTETVVYEGMASIRKAGAASANNAEVIIKAATANA
jgi:ferric-dicitrate binding protein FerR (iron transport regulator)